MNEHCEWVPMEGGGWRCNACYLKSAKLKAKPVSWTCRYGQQPPLTRRAWNLAESLAAFVSDGCRLVDGAEYRRRLETCNACDRRSDGKCLECGCYLTVKGKGRAFDCPLGKWKELGDG